MLCSWFRWFGRFPGVARAFCPRASQTVDNAVVKRSRLFILAAVPLSMVLIAWLSARAASPRVTNVVVQFDDGSQQKLPAAEPTDVGTVPPSTEPTTAPATQTSSADWPRPILGVNLESIRDYERQFMFIDAIKSSRKWGSAAKPYDQQGPMGDDGWPAGDAGTLVMTEVKNVNGVYRFSATGRCELATPNSPASVTNQIYDAAHNRTMADVVVKAAADKIVTLNLAFKNTNGGIKDIKLIRPGYATDESIFTREFLNALSPFDAIRFMDYLKTNNSTISKWADRVHVTDAQFNSKGGPYEYAIELGNKTQKDIWLNVPALADDDFITQLGNLVREKLKPNLHCYVEYSNEVWNGQFKQFQQNLEAAQAAVAAGDTTLSDGGKDTNKFYWARKRIAQRAVQISQLMRASDDPRIRVVLASQVGFSPPGGVLKMQLEFVEKNYGAPNKFFYAVAGAPYFSPGKDENDPDKKKWFTQRSDITVDQICQRLLDRTGTSCNDNVKAFHALARKYGLKSFAYEGGLDLQQYGNNLDVKNASQMDLRTGRAIEDYLIKWYTGGGDAMFYFTLSGKNSKFGYWGLTEDVRDLITPKFLAAVRVSTRLRQGNPMAAPVK